MRADTHQVYRTSLRGNISDRPGASQFDTAARTVEFTMSRHGEYCRTAA
jgi:hypothetical protein